MTPLAVRGDLADDPAQVGDQALERDAQEVLVGARRDLDGQVAAGDRLGGGRLLAQVGDRVAERGGQAADLVVGLDVELDVDVAVGDALGGLGDGADRLGEHVGDQQDHDADEDQHDQADDQQRGAHRRLTGREHLGHRDGGQEAPARAVDLDHVRTMSLPVNGSSVSIWPFLPAAIESATCLSSALFLLLASSARLSLPLFFLSGLATKTPLAETANA